MRSDLLRLLRKKNICKIRNLIFILELLKFFLLPEEQKDLHRAKQWKCGYTSEFIFLWLFCGHQAPAPMGWAASCTIPQGVGHESPPCIPAPLEREVRCQIQGWTWGWTGLKPPVRHPVKPPASGSWRQQLLGRWVTLGQLEDPSIPLASSAEHP